MHKMSFIFITYVGCTVSRMHTPSSKCYQTFMSTCICDDGHWLCSSLLFFWWHLQ